MSFECLYCKLVCQDEILNQYYYCSNHKNCVISFAISSSVLSLIIFIYQKYSTYQVMKHNCLILLPAYKVSANIGGCFVSRQLKSVQLSDWMLNNIFPEYFDDIKLEKYFELGAVFS